MGELEHWFDRIDTHDKRCGGSERGRRKARSAGDIEGELERSITDHGHHSADGAPVMERAAPVISERGLRRVKRVACSPATTQKPFSPTGPGSLGIPHDRSMHIRKEAA
jgi:hypothetical protein